MMGLWETEAERAAGNIRAEMEAAKQSMDIWSEFGSLESSDINWGGWEEAFDAAFEQAKETGENMRSLYQSQLEAQTGEWQKSAEDVAELMRVFDQNSQAWAGSTGLDVSGGEVPRILAATEQLNESLSGTSASLGRFGRQVNLTDDDMGKLGADLDSDFSGLRDKFDDFGWSEYLENIDWDSFIEGVDLSQYVKTEADTFGTYARGTNNFPGGIGLVGERGPELVPLPRGSRITPAGEFGGITFGYGAIRINTGPINTVTDEKQLEMRLTKSISRAIESAVTR